jgi:hypothetical protein
MVPAIVLGFIVVEAASGNRPDHGSRQPVLGEAVKARRRVVADDPQRRLDDPLSSDVLAG